MSKLLLYLRWLIIGGAALCLVLAVVVALYTRTEHFRRLVQDQLIGAINESIRGSVSLERIDGTLWGDVNLYNLRVRYEDHEIAHLPSVTISLSWRALIRGRLQVSRVEAVEPAVRLERDGAGRWNLVEAFSSGSEEPAGFAISLQQIILRQAKIDVALAGGEPRKYNLSAVDVKGRLTMAAAGLSVDLREVAARLGIPDMAELSIQGALSYRDTSALPSLTLTDWQINSAASRIKISGRVQDFDKPQFQAKATLEKLAAADLKRFVPDWPLKHEVSGVIDLSGALDALETDINLGAGNARLSGRLNLNVAQESPQFEGRFKVVGFDAREFFELEKFAGVVSGDIEIKGRGAALGAMQAAGSLNVRALQAGGWTLGNAIVNVQLRQRAVSFDGKLKGELGGADWRGQITLDPAPRYALDIAVRDLDIQRVSAEGGVTGGKLNFNGRIKGAGLKIPEMNTLAEIEILPSSVGPLKVQQGAVSVSLAGGRIHVTRGTLRTADTTVGVKGDIGTDLRQRGTLDYEVQAKDLSSWLSLVGQKGSGSVTLKGRAQGNLTTLKTEGSAKLKGLNFAGAAVNEGTIAFDLVRAGAHWLPAGTVRADLTGVQSGIRLRKVDAAAKLAPNGPYMIHFDAKAQDERNGAHALSGDIGWQDSTVSARLSNLSLQLPDGAWKLAQPATIMKNGDDFLFENVTLRNGSKGFTIDGRAGLAGEQALGFRLQEFPMDTLAELLPQLPKLTGILTVEAQVSGTAAAPEISATAELRDSTIGGQAYAGVVADLLYQKRQARMNLTVRQDASHTLNATGSLPLALSWQGAWRSEVRGPMDAHIRSAGLSLAFLNAYSGKSLDEVGGNLTLDMRARGSFKEPELSGTFRVLDGKLRAKPLGVNVTDIAVEGTLGTRAVIIRSLSARAAEGSLLGKGTFALKDNTLDDLKLSLAVQRWPAINTRRYQAQIQGKVDVNGSLTAPKVTGAIEIVEANSRPDLEFLQKSATAVKRDNTIVIVKGTDPALALQKKEGETQNFAESTLFKQTSMDVVLRAPGNLWIRHTDGVIELRGNLRLVKQADAPLDVTGVAELVHGWVAFQGRRFDLTRGRIEFTGGGKIDPVLDIVALRRLPEYQVEALVGGTAESPTLTLRSQPHLDQADIIALLLFGKPTKDLNRGEQASVQQSASGLASGFLAGKVLNSISEAIGLDRLGIQFANVEASADEVGIGGYIGRDTYVSVSEELEGEKGQRVKVEYQLAPEWKIGTSTDTDGSSGVQIIWSKQY